MMMFVVHKDENGEMICKTLHKFSSIKTYIKQNGLIEKECKIFDGHRLEWNKCYEEWDHAIIVSCSTCGKDMTGYEHGKFPCDISLENGCPDKGDGGW